MISRIRAPKSNLIVLYWSDESRNVFFTGDPEMNSFIKWKQGRAPELTVECKIMSVDDYEEKHYRLCS